MLELSCKEAVFHFNKGHLADPTIPMWVVKTKGKTYYINHMECDMPWSTKETPDNSKTKGSFKFKDCLLTIDDENCASLRALTDHDKSRLRNAAKGITRVITKWGGLMTDALKNMQVKHGPIKTIGGACTTTFYVTDVHKKDELTAMLLTVKDLRELMPNEPYYRMYDEAVTKNVDYYDEDEYYDEPDDSEE
jgi:hypothetical protein